MILPPEQVTFSLKRFRRATDYFTKLFMSSVFHCKKYFRTSSQFRWDLSDLKINYKMIAVKFDFKFYENDYPLRTYSKNCALEGSLYGRKSPPSKLNPFCHNLKITTCSYK